MGPRRAVALLLSSPSLARAGAETCALRALGRTARAYRALPALRETLVYQVDAPGAERVEKRLVYGFDGRLLAVP